MSPLRCFPQPTTPPDLMEFISLPLQARYRFAEAPSLALEPTVSVAVSISPVLPLTHLTIIGFPRVHYPRDNSSP